jgi:hypothetical protein
MVAIPSYRGPTEWYTTDEVPIPIVPIVPSVARWEKNGRHCSRKQYPLRLAYAITIHKCQGMTLSKVVIEFGEHDFCRGLSFVAVSRARALCDIAFRSRVKAERMKKLGGLDKVAEDLHRRQRLPFRDAVDTALLGYTFND